MKCAQCSKEIEETFMEKIKGTYIKGKAYCSECQRTFFEKEAPPRNDLSLEKKRPREKSVNEVSSKIEEAPLEASEEDIIIVE